MHSELESAMKTANRCTSTNEPQTENATMTEGEFRREVLIRLGGVDAKIDKVKNDTTVIKGTR